MKVTIDCNYLFVKTKDGETKVGCKMDNRDNLINGCIICTNAEVVVHDG